MSLFLKRFVYLVDSNQRLSGTSSNFSISVPIPAGNNYNRVLITHAIIPKSYYLIRAGFNTFTLREGVSNYTVTILIGNYSLLDFIIEMQRALNDTNGSFTYNTPTFSQRTGKFSFTVSNNVTQPSFIFTTNVYEQFGFEANSTNVFANDGLTSSTVINLNPNEMVFVCSDMCANAVGNILEVIPMCNVPDYSFQYYQATSNHHMKDLTNNRNQIFSFRITDSRYNVIDLNGKEISIGLCIHREEDEKYIEKRQIHEVPPAPEPDQKDQNQKDQKPDQTVPESKIETTTNMDASSVTIGWEI